ncbi:type III effector HrpK [Brenneria goodwinii]|uniref:type III effector HrpK domain-containing protein n=1 Tax=Brenneria goodwinii TaxID=1109412 RepID=UPI000EF1D16D|nr:type III effector HrpK [Brenneria goodwinii]MCG8159355.1 type III effector HrpK [Brenneria goodwinii]MCG8164476.1 type III effector HrpK [Brenneria goodwinii]MCG8168958.1 type III effector HrpK [Brenneria goodwinii]MCG8173214.1 type III effector HrpK [Brenneria goodwinii]
MDVVSRIDGGSSAWSGVTVNTHDVAAPMARASSSTGAAIEFGQSSHPPASSAAGSAQFDLLQRPAAPALVGKRFLARSDEEKVIDGSFLDQSKYSITKALNKWQPLLEHLPEGERGAAAQQLNRPLAAARMLLDGGADADKAMAYIRRNPALLTALDTGKDGGKADGYISRRDIKSFIKNMEKRTEDAQDSLRDYNEAHPDADAQSRRLVQSSAMLLANAPLIQAADPAKSSANAQPTENKRTSTLTDLQAIVNDNPVLSPMLHSAAKLWSHPGLFGELEHADVKGEKLARVAHDGKLMFKDIKSWIKDRAPADPQQASGTFHNAAALGLAAKTDISDLDEDVFDRPQDYNGSQKAATLIKLQQTLEQVIAGRQYRDTSQTEQQLMQHIETLQQDSDVIRHFEQNVPQESLRLQLSDAELAQALLEEPAAFLTSSKGYPSSSTQKETDQPGIKSALEMAENGLHKAVSFSQASMHTTDLTRAAGNKVVVGLVERAGTAVVGKVVGAIAGEAAGAAAASAVGAAAGPVGWAVSGALALGMGIADLVGFFNAKSKLRHRRADFARTVNPVLEQFNIAKPR